MEDPLYHVGLAALDEADDLHLAAAARSGGSTSYTRLMSMAQVEIEPGFGPSAADFWASSANGLRLCSSNP